ncbi:polyhydroxyalkanoate synthesis repressor PhaR [Hyphomicrobium sp.]|uniref:polyhydroxyalkanoate synthesis repressor PhaR n=1 Tax=Hyphomicrobium sp. TaxID=82 RepID=UPI000FB8B3F8|nr:polyhydroxyalkanoate synthesis repressor PhaR [Hyphomicrobium sp.]RUO97234.1 MAG: polyhydroxyalkanoate synthesis repressor PhaR [Hyphomicrobium sp.]
MLTNPDPQTQAPKKEAVVIKKYANRRLYNTETSTYVTLEDLAKMVRGDRDFVVYDAKNGDDLTHAVLTQIIVEQESREGGQALLPIPFLRQLIRFYDDSIARMVPSYLQFSLEHLVKEQSRFREQFASAFSNPAAAFDFYQQQARQNMAMFEQAISMWASFGASGNKPGEGQPAGSPAASSDTSSGDRNELNELKSQLSAMQQKIEKLSQSRT